MCNNFNTITSAIFSYKYKFVWIFEMVFNKYLICMCFKSLSVFVICSYVAICPQGYNETLSDIV